MNWDESYKLAEQRRQQQQAAPQQLGTLDRPMRTLPSQEDEYQAARDAWLKEWWGEPEVQQGPPQRKFWGEEPAPPTVFGQDQQGMPMQDQAGRAAFMQRYYQDAMGPEGSGYNPAEAAAAYNQELARARQAYVERDRQQQMMGYDPAEIIAARDYQRQQAGLYPLNRREWGGGPDVQMAYRRPPPRTVPGTGIYDPYADKYGLGWRR